MPDLHLESDQFNETFELDSGDQHVVHLPKNHQLRVRLNIDPSDPATFDDRFTLYMNCSGNRFRQTKTIRDDQIPGDEFLDLVFEWCQPDATFSLEIDPGDEGQPYFLFKDAPFSEFDQ